MGSSATSLLRRLLHRWRLAAMLVAAPVVLGIATPAYGQSLSGGDRHALGIRPDGTIAAWGDDNHGQVSGAATISGVTAVSGGSNHSLALLSNGTVIAWGDDRSGQVSGANTISGATAISAGYDHSLALNSNGTISAWGNDGTGQVSGAGSITDAIAISGGLHHSLALHSNGLVSAWGYSGYGLHTGANAVRGATAISAGGQHSLALLSNGKVSAWGDDRSGQVSGANAVNDATAISAGFEHSLALRSNGTVAAWGADGWGQVSGAAAQTNVVYTFATPSSSFAVHSNGTISNWGFNGWNNEGLLNTPVGFQLPTTVRWVSATNGDYLNSHLWNGRIPSTALSTAVFDNSGTYSIHFGNTARAKGLEVAAGELTFDLGNHVYQVETNVNIASGASLTANGIVTAGGLLTNDGTYNTNVATYTDSLNNNGVLNVDGFVGVTNTLSNQGIIENGGTISVNGLLDNAGTYNNHVLTDVGTLNNNGTLNVAGLVNVATSLTNRGTIEIYHGSQLKVSNILDLSSDGYAHFNVGGTAGNAEVSILDGGSISNAGFAKIGGNSGASGLLTVSGPGSQLSNAYSMEIGTAGFGKMVISDGGRVVSGTLGSPTRIGGGNAWGEVVVHGSNSTWEMSSDLIIGGFFPSLLSIEGGGVVTNQYAYLGPAVVTVKGDGSTWNNQGGLFVSYHGTQLGIEDGGVVTSTSGHNQGHVVVTGNGSRWDISGDLSGSGNMDVLNGGVVTSQNSIGSHVDVAYGVASVSGVGSEWINSGNMVIGGSGAAYGALSISDGGLVDTWNASVVHGDVTVGSSDANFGATWLISNDFQLGANRYSTLTVEDGGNVIVGNRTTITPNGQVYMNGGRFEFGKMSLESYYQVGRYGGAMAGSVEISGVHNLANLEGAFTYSPTDLTQVRLSNFGTLAGSGWVEVGLDNQATGHVRATANDWMRIGGAFNTGAYSNTNAGRITNLGGTIEFGGHVVNSSTGFITGRGAFIAERWDNHGSIAVSGTTDIIGHVNNFNGALIVTSGNATTTFYDSVVNNGEIRTSGSGSSVFFDDVSGAGSFTGTGHVFFEGNVNPGNSPAVVNFGGALTLGSGSHTLMELGGLNPGQFDQFKIAGDLNIMGSLSVSLWDNFQLGSNMSFLIADIGGARFGTFQGLGEGAFVGKFSGQDLFITYSAGNGNDIALFSAVPEPSAFLLCLMPTIGLLSTRRSRSRAK
jgi:T5SS/PEP-CTERM-associated repeat protein